MRRRGPVHQTFISAAPLAARRPWLLGWCGAGSAVVFLALGCAPASSGGAADGGAGGSSPGGATSAGGSASGGASSAGGTSAGGVSSTGGRSSGGGSGGVAGAAGTLSGGTPSVGGSVTGSAGTSSAGGGPSTGGVALDSTGCAALNAPITCGNGTIEVGEECDGANHRGATCTDVDPIFGGGTLGCRSNCTWDLSACTTTGTCGNGVVDSGEDCEPGLYYAATQLAVTCNDFPPHMGTSSQFVQCDPSTCRWDFSACDGAPKAVCGNGIVEVGEACDGAGRSTLACVQIDPFVGGVLGCHPDCTLDVSRCFDCSGARCGDGVAAGSEFCDGSDLRGATCQSQGYLLGQLRCSPTCVFDTSGCSGICYPHPVGVTCQ